MNQLIVRLLSNSEDAEILVHEQGDLFQVIEKDKLINILFNFLSKDKKESIRPRVNRQNIYASAVGCSVIIQNENYKIVPYDNKSYKILFPNSIYFIYYSDNVIRDIVAYSFKEFKGLDTELYNYPMPNMLTGNKICLGTAIKKVNSDIEKSLNSILCTEFTHVQVNNIFGFKSTDDYFNYLTKNQFPYEKLQSANKKVGDLIDE